MTARAHASVPEADGPSPDRAPGGDASGNLSRRSLLRLGAAGLTTAGLAGSFAGGYAIGGDRAAAQGTGTGTGTVYAFTGAHQAGIVTPAQDRLHFATWDLTTTRREDLVQLLRAWTFAADRMTRGLPAGPLGPTSGPYDAPPDDTGETEDLPAAGLTLTFGFGGSLFTTADGTDRFGLAHRRPAALVDLPHFSGDALEAARCGGDLAVQACADDPQVAVHAIRNLARIAFGTAAVRWSQLGYGRTSSTSTAQTTPRNLFGFKDGTANIKAEDPATAEDHVWAPADPQDPAGGWMAGGSYLVARRIRMQIETWDRSSLHEQEAVIGRTKGSGAPLSGGTEFTAPDLARTGSAGDPLVPVSSHVRLAHPSVNGGVQMLRRGYNYTDGSDGLGRLDAGLFFLAYVRDPRSHYIPMQAALARHDALSEYLRHTGSGVWAVPPGVPDGAHLDATSGTYIGEGLFA